MATFIEGAPLCGIDLKSLSVCSEVRELEIGDTSREPFANLAAYLAIARPAQIELRQRPLEKGYAVAILHSARRS